MASTWGDSWGPAPTAWGVSWDINLTPNVPGVNIPGTGTTTMITPATGVTTMTIPAVGYTAMSIPGISPFTGCD